MQCTHLVFPYAPPSAGRQLCAFSIVLYRRCVSMIPCAMETAERWRDCWFGRGMYRHTAGRQAGRQAGTLYQWHCRPITIVYNNNRTRRETMSPSCRCNTTSLASFYGTGQRSLGPPAAMRRLTVSRGTQTAIQALRAVGRQGWQSVASMIDVVFIRRSVRCVQDRCNAITPRNIIVQKCGNAENTELNNMRWK